MTNNDLIDNLLQIWTLREVTQEETIELLEESKGDNDKGRIFYYGNKRQMILNTKLSLGYGFPCKLGESKNVSLNDMRNSFKITQKIMIPVKKLHKPGR